jgi:plasmid stabilization system protein ParE
LKELAKLSAIHQTDFSPFPGHEPSGIRRRPHGNYLIFYRVRESIVDVLHILHGARNYETILFPDDV